MVFGGTIVSVIRLRYFLFRPESSTRIFLPALSLPPPTYLGPPNPLALQNMPLGRFGEFLG